MFDNDSKTKQIETTPLQKLQILIENHPVIRAEMPTETSYLMMLLYSRNLNVSNTFTMIKNLIKFKQDNRDIFQNMSIGDQEIRAAIENSLPELHAEKDRRCRTIIVFHANNWDGLLPLTSIYRAFLLILDYALRDVHTQNNGFVIIVNWERFPFKKSTWLNPRTINSIIYCIQECYPVKILEVHFVGTPWHISAMFNVFKWSFSEDIRDNFFVHGRNLSTLHEFVHQDVLPSELGGSKRSYNPLELIAELENFCGIV